MNDSTPATILAVVCGLMCVLPVLTLFLGIWIGRTRVSLTIEPRFKSGQHAASTSDATYAIRETQK